MKVVYLPIDVPQQVLGPVPVKTVSKAVANMLIPGTYVHCLRGSDRTGLCVGTYRVWIGKWTKSDARAEMLKFGFTPALHGLDDFWEDQVR
jgi:protein tyrosine/serine phosphatase